MESGLPSVLLVAAGALALLSVLPGLALKLYSLIRRRRPSPAVLGPLFWYELVTVTRRGAQFRLRTAYSIFLLVALLVAYLGEFRELNPIRLLFGPGGEFPRERVTAFAERFFHIFLFGQLIALTVVTPVFAGGSITEEKDRGTLAFLQTSLLSNREIVLGKLAARVVFVLGLALTGLPVLAITLLFGGVDPAILATSFVAAVMSTVSLAAYSFWQATRADTLKAVLLAAYPFAWTLSVVAGCCVSCTGGTSYLLAISPFTLLMASIRGPLGGSFDLLEATKLLVAIHGGMAMLFAILAMGNVRAILLSKPRAVAVEPEPSSKPRWVEVGAPDHRRRERPAVRFVRVPPVDDGDNPFFWKELHFGGKLPSFEADAFKGCGLALLVAVIAIGAFGILVQATSSDRPQEVLNPVFRLASIAMVAFVVPFAGVRAVGCVAYERQRQTLDSLFTLPVERGAILAAKGRAALEWLRYWLYGYAAVALVPLVTGSVPFFGFLLTLTMIASAVPFFLALAVWLSVRCVTVVRATAWFLVATFAAFLLPPMLAVLANATANAIGGPDLAYDLVTVGLSFPYAIASVVKIEGPNTLNDTGIVLVGTGTVAMSLAFWCLAWRLWRNAVNRFENEGR